MKKTRIRIHWSLTRVLVLYCLWLGSLVLWIGCETTSQLAKDDVDASLLKKTNPAMLLDGDAVEMRGMVTVERVDELELREAFSFFGNKRNEPIHVPVGSRNILLESSFNRDGKIYVYQAQLNFDVEQGSNYFPVAGFEVNSGKAWMWIKDHDRKVRVSNRSEATFVKSFAPEEESFLDIWSYESIIDQDVMAERRAACDLSQLPGYEEDLSLVRGDEKYGDRDTD
ncbi:hypothetical protein F7C95_01045 [Opitutia bacterium ISCC 51]|nr:hypothetical protein F7C95_01045 [Opitutae bacterium ISCC 51]QXD28601.1 hypothetical protein GA003_01040 [Opitutae bacterium ISCC 52]